MFDDSYVGLTSSFMPPLSNVISSTVHNACLMGMNVQLESVPSYAM